jgi:chromate transporter
MSSTNLTPEQSVPARTLSVSFREALWTWCRVAGLSFGGPTGQIAVMHRILVEEKKWISQHRFLHALNYCMLLPGPEAQQLATYIGWLLHGTLGGLTAGALFIVPGFLAILVLSFIYAEYQQTAAVAAIFFGLKPAVMAIVVEAVVRIGKRVLRNGAMLALAAAAFVAIFFFEAPFPLIILAAGTIGLVGGRLWPDLFHVIKGHAKADAPPEHVVDSAAVERTVSFARQVAIAAVWLLLWFGPIALLAALLGPQSVYTTEATFFSQAAVVTFGGAYAVLPYIAQAAVERFKWLTSAEMLDGLGMAETTPGPLIMVVQFVGFLGAYRNPGELPPLAAGVLGSVITVWVTFVPCFLYISVGAPYIERLRTNRSLSCALSAITAAVVGVVLNLALWFAIKTLLADSGEQRYTLWKLTDTLDIHVRWFQPSLATLSLAGLTIAIVAAIVIFVLKRGMFAALGAGVALGIVFYALGLR